MYEYVVFVSFYRSYLLLFLHVCAFLHYLGSLLCSFLYTCVIWLHLPYEARYSCSAIGIMAHCVFFLRFTLW